MFLDPEKSLTVFSTEGDLKQCDNATEAVRKASLSLGCTASDGAIICCLKDLPRLAKAESFYKVFQICSSIGVTYSGMTADFKSLFKIAVEMAQDYVDEFGEDPKLDSFIQMFSLKVQEHTQKGGYRPYGCTLMFIGSSLSGPSLYEIYPSGAFSKVKVSAAGKNSDNAKRAVSVKRNCFESNKINVLQSLKCNAGKNILSSDVSAGVLSNGKFSILTQSEINDILSIC